MEDTPRAAAGHLLGSGPRRSPLRRILVQIVAGLGVAAAIALIVRLLQQLFTKRVADTSGGSNSVHQPEKENSERERADAADLTASTTAAPPASRPPPSISSPTDSSQLTMSGEQAPPTGASPETYRKWQNAALKSGLLSRGTVGSPPVGNTFHKPFAAFVSHVKAEASMEARFMQTEIEGALGRRAFLDSDDLRDLGSLVNHVKDSDVLVLLQTKSILTRPWCLIEMITAMDAGVPIVGVCLTKHAFPYDFEEAAHFMTFLDTLLDPSSAQLLSEHRINLVDAAFKLSTRIPKVISVQLDTCGSRNMLNATVADLISAMRAAKPVPLPSREEWLEQRAKRSETSTQRHAGAHGRPFDSRSSSTAAGATIAKPAPPPRAPLPPPKECAELVDPCDMPELKSVAEGGTLLLINGGIRLGPECPIEKCCGFTVPVLLLLHRMGVAFTEYVIDLQSKPEWLAKVVGRSGMKRSTTPMMHYDGKWYFDSADIIRALHTLFPGKASTVFFPPEGPGASLLEESHIDAVGVSAISPLLMAAWDCHENHPLFQLFTPLEAALAAQPDGSRRFGSLRGLCLTDLRAGAWAHGLRNVDELFSPVPLDWPAMLPHVHRWLEHEIMPLVREATTSDRRYQLLMSISIGSKMPALASRIPSTIKEDIEATRELACVSTTGVFAV